jgi:hypothetical protein
LAPSKKAYTYAWKSYVVFISSIPSNERSADVSDATLLSGFGKKQDRKQNFALNNKLHHHKWAFCTRILTALVFGFFFTALVRTALELVILLILLTSWFALVQ